MIQSRLIIYYLTDGRRDLERRHIVLDYYATAIIKVIDWVRVFDFVGQWGGAFRVN